MNTAVAPASAAPMIWTEKEKILRERVVAEMLIKKFAEFNLVESRSAGGSYFHFKDHVHSNPYNKTIVQFAGGNASKLKQEAIIYFRQQGHKAEDRTIYGSFVLHLKDIEPMPEGRIFGRSDTPPVEKVPVKSDLQGGLSPKDMVQTDSALQRGLEAVRLLHESKLLLGTKNRRAELVFLPSHLPEVAVEYNYFDEIEASEAVKLSEDCFGYTPLVRPGNRNAEKVVLQFCLNELKNANFRTLRPRKSRTIEGRQLSAVKVATFIVAKMLRFECKIEGPSSLENTIFRLGHNDKRDEVLERLTVFGIPYAADKLDARCFRIKNADMIGAKMTVVNSTADTPTNTSNTMAEEVFDAVSARALITGTLKAVPGWTAGSDYGMVPPPAFAADGTLLYMAISAKAEPGKQVLRDNIGAIQKKLPAGVEVTFEGRLTSTTSLFFYFPDRASVMRKIDEGGMRQGSPRQKEQEPASALDKPEEAVQSESLALRMLMGFVDLATEDELTLLKQKLGFTEGMSEEQVRQRDQQRDEERANELEKQFAGHVILDTSDPTVQKMMHEYNARLFRSLAEFRKVKQEA